ncbi:MAG: hypothetical protein NZM04_11160 [Methylacidiphilales bacterium]|nr:hypothetical protein [Candidatus Methylacidiphilales bacterium]
MHELKFKLNMNICVFLTLYIFACNNLTASEKRNIYIDDEVLKLIQTQNQDRRTLKLNHHSYIPKNLSFPIFEADFLKINKELIERINKDKIDTDVHKIDDYGIKSLYIIHSIINKREERIKDLVKDFKNVLAAIILAGYLRDSEHRELVTERGLEYLGAFSPEEISMQEVCYEDWTSAFTTLMSYLLWGTQVGVNEDLPFYSFGKLTKKQKKAYMGFYYDFVTLRNNFSKIQIDTLSKKRLVEKCNCLSLNFLKESVVISPRKLLASYVKLENNEIKIIIKDLVTRLKDNPFYRFIVTSDIERNIRLTESQKAFIDRILGLIVALKNEPEWQKLNLDLDDVKASHNSRIVDEFVEFKDFSFVFDPYTFGIAISTAESISRECMEKINECLYCVETIIHLAQELESRLKKEPSLN